MAQHSATHSGSIVTDRNTPPIWTEPSALAVRVAYKAARAEEKLAVGERHGEGVKCWARMTRLDDRYAASRRRAD